jgi:hypothetical protein
MATSSLTTLFLTGASGKTYDFVLSTDPSAESVLDGPGILIFAKISQPHQGAFASIKEPGDVIMIQEVAGDLRRFLSAVEGTPDGPWATAMRHHGANAEYVGPNRDGEASTAAVDDLVKHYHPVMNRNL